MGDLDFLDSMGKNIDTITEILIKELKQKQDEKKKIKDNESAYLELIYFSEDFIQDDSFMFYEKKIIINNLIEYFTEIEEYEKCIYLTAILNMAQLHKTLKYVE